jgi:hypothetical protein
LAASFSKARLAGSQSLFAGVSRFAMLQSEPSPSASMCCISRLPAERKKAVIVANDADSRMEAMPVENDVAIFRGSRDDKMQSTHRFDTSFGAARVVASSRDIDPDLWKRAFAGHCKDYRYYEISEQTLHGQFDHRYLVLENARTGDVAIQPVFFVEQDLTTGLPRKVRGALNWPRKFLPRWLQMRMLMVGCSAGEGALDREHPWAVEAMHEALAIYAKKTNVAMVLLKDFPSAYRDALVPFSSNGYRRAPSMPACALELDFKSFDEFMQKKLSHAFRKNLRRKFKKLSQHPPLTLEVLHDASHVVDEIYPLYKQTFARSEMRFEELTKDFLVRIGREMPERARFFIWRQEGKAVAFALCLVHDGTIHDLNLGLDYSVALDLHLYFVTWRDIIQWAVSNGLRRYYTAPLNYDPKLHLRMELAPLDLYAWHTSPVINPIFKRALNLLQPARHDPVIRKFPNAREL